MKFSNLKKDKYLLDLLQIIQKAKRYIAKKHILLQNVSTRKEILHYTGYLRNILNEMECKESYILGLDVAIEKYIKSKENENIQN